MKRPGPAKKRDASIHLRTTPEAVAAIKKQAEKEQRTVSDMVRILLARGLDASR